MKHILTYIVLALFTAASYVTVRGTITAQEPTDTSIIASPLSLNLILFICLLGAFAPWLTRRLFPTRFKTMLVPVSVLIAVCLVLFLKAVGFEVRF